MKRFISISFKRELLVTLIFVSMLPLVMSSIFMVSSMKRKIASDYSNSARTQLDEVAERFETSFAKLEQIADAICLNSDVKELLYVKDSEEKKGMYQALYSGTSSGRGMGAFSLYSLGGNRKYSTGENVSRETLPTYFGILKRASEDPGRMVYDNVSGDSGSTAIRTCRAVTDESGNVIGFFVTDIYRSLLQGLLGSADVTSNTCMLLDEYWHRVSPVADDTVTAERLRSAMLEGSSFAQIEEDSNFYTVKLKTSDFVLVLKQREIFSADVTESMYLVGLTVAGVSLLLCLIIGIVMSRQLTKPIDSLKRAMNEVEKGNLDISVESSRKDELGMLSKNFNSMTKQLKYYMDYEVRKQHELDEANIAMLQAQLNPHFLYNTLDTMKWVAKANQIPEIATMSSNLAKILRSSISSAKFVKLSDELALCKSYIDIQEVRFEDKFVYTADVPDELLNCLVPKLILQPIVENAILHGLEDKDRGEIHIQASLCGEGGLKIVVSDDGCGMSDEVIEHLNSHDRRQLVEHIGFFNVDTIIRMHYGEEYGMKAENGENGGARITILLPVERGI